MILYRYAKSQLKQGFSIAQIFNFKQVDLLVIRTLILCDAIVNASLFAFVNFRIYR